MSSFAPFFGLLKNVFAGYIYPTLPTDKFIIGDNETINEEYLRVAGGIRTDTNGYLELTDGSAVLTSPADTARIIYNDVTNTLQASINGGAYADIITSTSINPVNTIAALGALDDTLLANNSTILVRSLLDYWMLQKTSAETIDGITVIATLSGTGRWVRLCLWNITWRKQLTWYINPTTGNDENTGLTSGTAIKTWLEFKRRHGPALGAGAFVNVYLVGPVFAQDITIDMAVAIYPEVLIIHGTQTPLYSGTVTGYQAWNTGARQEPRVTDAAIPVSWTASNLVNQQFVVTSGPNAGSSTFVAAELGAKTARIGMPYNDNMYSDGEPSVGNTFTVYSLTEVTGSFTIDCQAGRVWVYNLYINPTLNIDSRMNINTGITAIINCKISIMHVFQRGALVGYTGCLLKGGQMDMYNGQSMIDWCVLNGTIGTYTGAQAETYYKNLIQNGSFHAYKNGSIYISGDVAAFETTASSVLNSDIFGRIHVASPAIIWGTGNTHTYAINIESDAAVMLGTTPDIQGSVTANCNVGGVNKTFAEAYAGYINLANLARAIQE
jgi:hypothetical protein